jgi:hypothetical protein
MKKLLFGWTVAVILALTAVPQAQAFSLLRIAVSGTTISCDNSTAAGVAACTAAGFVTSLGASGVNAITFTGTINGVLFGNVFLSSNNPGTFPTAFVLDTKFDVRNNSGAARTVTVDFGINNFTQPVGPTTFLSASQTANWTISTPGDTQSFIAWERNTNDLVIPGGTAVVLTAACVSPGGLTAPCGQPSQDTPVNATAPFALTGRQDITMAAGTVGTYSGTSTLNSVPAQVPEPSSIVLLGTGMLFLAGRQWRKRKN